VTYRRLRRGSFGLISQRSAAIARSADDLSGNWVIGPITILRCFCLPSGPASRHLKSQTSEPFERVDRMILPFCMASPVLLLVWSTKTSWSECHCGKWSRAEDAGGSDHRRRLRCSCADTLRTLLNSAAYDDAFSAGKNQFGWAVHVRILCGRLIRQATALLRRCPGVGCLLTCLDEKWGERSSQSKSTYQSVCATRTTRTCAGDRHSYDRL